MLALGGWEVFVRNSVGEAGGDRRVGDRGKLLLCAVHYPVSTVDAWPSERVVLLKCW